MERDPKTCGNSVKVENVYICNIEIRPCPALYFCEECAHDKTDRIVEAIAKLDAIAKLMEGGAK